MYRWCRKKQGYVLVFHDLWAGSISQFPILDIIGLTQTLGAQEGWLSHRHGTVWKGSQPLLRLAEKACWEGMLRQQEARIVFLTFQRAEDNAWDQVWVHPPRPPWGPAIPEETGQRSRGGWAHETVQSHPCSMAVPALCLLAALAAKSFSRVWLCVTSRAVDHQAPLSMGFSRQEYWSKLPFPSPGDLPDPRIELKSPTSPALARWLLYHWATKEAHSIVSSMKCITCIDLWNYHGNQDAELSHHPK